MLDLDWGHDETKNLLSRDGTAFYYGKIFSFKESNTHFDRLIAEIPWRSDELILFGKPITTRRQVAWFGDKPYDYHYSNSKKTAIPWTEQLQELKSIVEQKTGESYNSCLLNLYPSGDTGMGWHSDDERELIRNGSIASLSFGAERKFVFRHKQTLEKVEILLENGSLLEMKDEIQGNWQHSLPPSKKVIEERINLTFRKILE